MSSRSDSPQSTDRSSYRSRSRSRSPPTVSSSSAAPNIPQGPADLLIDPRLTVYPGVSFVAPPTYEELKKENEELKKDFASFRTQKKKAFDLKHRYHTEACRERDALRREVQYLQEELERLRQENEDLKRRE